MVYEGMVELPNTAANVGPPPPRTEDKYAQPVGGAMAHDVRMRRLTTPGGHLLMVPMDHGASMGPVDGLRPPEAALAAVAPHASCVTLHRGLVPAAAPHARDIGILMHLSASTDVGPDPHDKVLVATVEDAVRAGCDGVSLHINLGSRTEARQLRDAGRVATACAAWGMPLVAMVYPRGPDIPSPAPPGLVAHAARLGAELGADAVKVPFTDAHSFGDVVEGAGVPVIVAGGARTDLDALLDMVHAARDAGAMGVSVGRNVFGAPDPGAAMAAVAKVFA